MLLAQPIIIIHFLILVFLECTEAVATSLAIPLVTNFPGICAFIIGFSFTSPQKKNGNK